MRHISRRIRYRGLSHCACRGQKEYAAIKTALTLPYSNGPVEGQVNRLKFMKRSMYGRGGFELLRQRVLSAASLLSTKDAEDPNFWILYSMPLTRSR